MGRMLLSAFFVCSLAAFAIGCQHTAKATPYGSVTDCSGTDHLNRVEMWVEQAASFASNKSLPELRALAPVLSESVHTISGTADDGPNNVVSHNIRFDGLEVSGIEQDEVFLVTSLAITNNNWPLPAPLMIGADESIGAKIFGCRSRTQSRSAELFSCLTCSVRLTSHRGKITKVEYFFFSS